MKALARWAARHRVAVVVGWVVVLLGLAGAVVGAGTSFTDATNMPDSESSTAAGLLAQQFPDRILSESGTIVWQSTGVAIDDPAVQQAVGATLAEIARLPGVQGVTDPYDGHAIMINTATDTAYATVALERGTDIDPVVAAANGLASDTLVVHTGGAALTADPAASHGSEAIGIIAALVILFLLFRSLWAAVLPILTGVVSVGVSLLAVMLASNAMDVAATSLTMGALIGLGVGIDYALFIVNRHRQGLVAGASVENSLATAVNTSGRAVVFAGLTVVIALLGMVVVDLGLLTGMSQVAAVTVVFTVLAALTLLPALLALLGTKVLSPRQRAALAAGGSSFEQPARSGLAARWARVVERSPKLVAAGGLVVVVALAAPVVSLRVGDADAGADPQGSAGQEYFTTMADSFGAGIDAPILLVGRTPDAAATAAFDTLATTLPAVPGIASVIPAPTVPGATISLITVIPTTSAQTEDTAELVAHLRHDVLPGLGQGTGLQVLVGGTAVSSIDFGDALMSKLPLYLGLIALLGFLLLAVAFRSLLVPLVGALSNLVTLAVGLGVITAIFQFGWGSELLGVGSGAPIMYLVPVLVVGVMFGLSMDYQVFLASRIHEEWGHTRDNRRAIGVGIAETGKVVATAALIMLAVFASFGFSGERIISAIGIGLGLAVLVDAFVIRLAIVPAVMHLLGRHNWSYPRWADRITPRVSIEGSPDVVDAPVLSTAGTR